MQQKDSDNHQLARLAQELEKRMKKAQANAKGASKNKASLRDAEKETHKMRKELLEARDLNK